MIHIGKEKKFHTTYAILRYAKILPYLRKHADPFSVVSLWYPIVTNL